MKSLRHILLAGLLTAAVVVELYAYKPRIRRPQTNLIVAFTDTTGRVLWHRMISNGPLIQCDAMTALRGGGCVFAAWTDSCENRGGLWMVRLDTSGQVLWERCFTPEPNHWSYVFCKALLATAGGRLMVLGEAGWLLCVSDQGDVLWHREYQVGECRTLVPCADGGFLLAGFGERVAHQPPKGGFVLKIDSEGNEQWLRTFESGYTGYVHDATEGEDGRIIVVGEAYDDAHTDIRESDGWIVILDAKGNVIRNDIYGRSIGMRLLNVQAAPDGGFLVFGKITTPKEQPWTFSDKILMHLSDSGDSLWSHGEKEGWENKLPSGYLDRAMRMKLLHHIPWLSTRLKLSGMLDWMRANVSDGRLMSVFSSPTPGGYYYVATVEMLKDSVGSH